MNCPHCSLPINLKWLGEAPEVDEAFVDEYVGQFGAVVAYPYWNEQEIRQKIIQMLREAGVKIKEGK